MAPAFPRRGEIWLVQFPGDPKTRPALVVSPNPRNEYSHSVLAVPVTTNLRPAPTHVLLAAGQGGLAFESMARCENVTTLYKSQMTRGKFAGTISAALLRDVEQGLMRSFGITT